MSRGERVNLTQLDEAVERNITKLFVDFYENPAIFLSEADVECYLYALLINDQLISGFSPVVKDETPIAESKTLLVHAELGVEIRGADKNIDISICKPKEHVVSFSDWDVVISIEIKFNRREPARKEKSNILEDIKKVAACQKGYILWLNWDREISDGHLQKVKNSIDRYENVKLFYLDLFSTPIKTNVSKILNQTAN